MKPNSTQLLNSNWRNWPPEAKMELLKALKNRTAGMQTEFLHPRQNEFLNLNCEEALYGGAAGGGKTEALLRWLAQGVGVPGYSGLFLRRTYPQLSKSNDSPIMRSFRMYAPLGGRYHAVDHRWTFPSTAVIEFGSMQHETSVIDYQGPSYHRIAFDELTQFSETQYGFMFSRIRKAAGFPISLGVRGATNPGGPGHGWVRSKFVTDEAQQALKKLTYRDPSPKGIFWKEGRAFVPARVADNPSLDVDDYINRMLGHLPPKLREQMASGDWDAVEGALIDVANIQRYTTNPEGTRIHTYKKNNTLEYARDVSEMTRFATIDTASTAESAVAKTKKRRSYSVVGVWDEDRQTKHIFLRYVWRKRVDYVGLKENVKRVLKEWNVRKTYVETAHNGPALVSDLRSDFRFELIGPRL